MLCNICVIYAFCLLVVLVVQAIDWKDSSPICVDGVVNPCSLTHRAAMYEYSAVSVNTQISESLVKRVLLTFHILRQF